MLLYLLADSSCHSYWEESNDTSAQVFSFPLLTEKTQLLLLLLIQRVTVLRLQKTHINSGWQVHSNIISQLKYTSLVQYDKLSLVFIDLLIISWLEVKDKNISSQSYLTVVGRQLV